MKRENIQDIFALDSAQTAQLVHTLTPDRDDPGLIQVQFRAKGPVDDAVMQTAWNDAIARHEALRLTVQMPAGKKPMLVLGKVATLDIVHHDLSAHSADAQGQALVDLLASDRQQKLRLSDYPAMRIRCVTLAPDERHYIWTCHHIFLDGWSAAVILRDVLAFYEARLQSRAPGLPALPGLRDYYARLKDRKSQDSHTFWRAYLENCPTDPHIVRLISATPVDANPTVTGALPLPENLAGKLTQAASQTKSTPATLIGLAWALLLAACSGRQDIVFCKTVSGRDVDLDGIDRMAGSFARAVPVRCRFAPDDTVLTALNTLQKRHFSAQSHEHLPLYEIVEATEHTASLAAFDTLLVVQNHPWQEHAGAGDGTLAMSDFTSDIMSAFPLTLIATPGADLRLEYRADAGIDADLVRSFLAKLPEILKSLCTDPADMRIADLLAGINVPVDAVPDAETTRLGIIDDMLNGRIRKPRTPTELAIRGIWQDVLGRNDIDLDRDFVSLGGRSFAAMRMLAQIEALFGKRIPLVDFVTAPNIPALAAQIDGGAGTTAQTWKSYVPIQPCGSKPAIVFPHASASHVAFLQPLAQRLGKDQPFHAFQPIGLEGEAPPLKSFEAMAETYVNELLQVQPAGPYVVMGYCAGARLSLEVARLLQARGHEIATLIVLDTREPQPVMSAKDKLMDRLSRGRLDEILMSGMRRLKPNPLRRVWYEKTAGVDEQKRVHVDRVERACFAADVRYKGCRYPGCIKLFRSRENAWRTFKWEGFAESVDLTMLPVDHFDMFFEPDVGVLAEALSEHLEKVRMAGMAPPDRSCMARPSDGT